MTYFESFKAFVKAKPSDEQYNSWSQDCAIGQWAAQTFPGKVILAGFKNFTKDSERIFFVKKQTSNELHMAIRDSKTFGELSAKLERIA
jgi:hypothetical protein